MKSLKFFGFAAIVPFVCSLAPAEDWSQFRGGTAMSVSTGKPLASSPNGAPKDPLQWKLICLDPENGSILWEQTVAEAIPKYSKHASNTYATETPAASSDSVYVWFGSAGVMAAYDHSGKRLGSRLSGRGW